MIPGVISAGKVALKHLLGEIRAKESLMRSRISEDVILLRTIK